MTDWIVGWFRWRVPSILQDGKRVEYEKMFSYDIIIERISLLWEHLRDMIIRECVIVISTVL